ncbi:MAG: preprotein translocase subunit Sec61beta [Candidatus Aenigmatarchaeota archaeon]
MAKKKQNTMPSGFAGLTRYFDESPEKFRFTPHQIVIMASLLITTVGILHYLA